MSDIALQFNKPLITAGDMSADIPAASQDLSNVLGYCIQATWSGSPVGNIVVDASNDNINWKNLSTTAAGGSSGNLWSNVDGVHYVYIRVSYAYTSGSGTLNVTLSGKNYV